MIPQKYMQQPAKQHMDQSQHLIDALHTIAVGMYINFADTGLCEIA